MNSNCLSTLKETVIEEAETMKLTRMSTSDIREKIIEKVNCVDRISSS